MEEKDFINFFIADYRKQLTKLAECGIDLKQNEIEQSEEKYSNFLNVPKGSLKFWESYNINKKMTP